MVNNDNVIHGKRDGLKITLHLLFFVTEGS